MLPSALNTPVFTKAMLGVDGITTTVGVSLVCVVPEISVTAGPVGGFPVAVAVLVTLPVVLSPVVTVYVPVPVVLCPTANVVDASVTLDGVNLGSFTVTPVSGTLPVFVTVKL